MSPSKEHNQEASCWSSFLQVFCCSKPATAKSVSGKSSVASQSISDLATDEKPAYLSIVYDEPTQEPFPSMVQEKSLPARPAALDLSEEVGPKNEPVPSPALASPKPKRGHRSWASALSLMVGSSSQEHEKRFTSRGFHFPRNRTLKSTDSFDEIDTLPLAPPPRRNRMRSISAPEEPTVHLASAAAIIKVSMLDKKPNKPIDEQEDSCDLAPPGLSRDTPRPHTPPFPSPRMSMLPLPPPLPAAMKPSAKKRKSLTQVSYWLTRTQPAPRSTAEEETPIPQDQKSVREIIQRCFSQADSYCRRFSDGSVTTVSTCNTEDSRNILSGWSRNSMEVTRDENRYSRKCSTGGVFKPSPLANVGVAV